MMLRLDMRRTHDVGAARVDNDQFCTRASILAAQAALHSAGKDRMAVGRVRADNQDDIAVLDTVEILRSGARAKRCFQAIARRRMTNARAGIDVVVAKTSANQFLDQKRLFIVATAGRTATKRMAALFFPDPFQLGRGVG